MSIDSGELGTSGLKGLSGADTENTPHNHLPKLPPRVELESKRVLKSAISANKALAELRMAGDLIPNQAVLIRAILLQEAKVSSEIENIVTTNDELYRAYSAGIDSTDYAAREVLKYEESLWYGYQHVVAGGLLTSGLFVKLAQIIKQYEINVRSSSGTRIVDLRTGRSVYAPPEGAERIRSLLDNLSEYMYEEDGVDPLIKMAVAHYQFEAIHPFEDGNGRTGRVLNILYLVQQELIGTPVLYLSKYIIQNRRQYNEGLRRVTEEGAWEDWIVYMLAAVEETARDTKNRIIQVRDSLRDAVLKASQEMKKGYKKELVELVFQQPYTRIANVMNAGLAQRETASQYLQELARIGLLERHKYGRDVLFVNRMLLRILAD